MGDPLAFLTIPRRENGERQAAERVNDWGEYVVPLADEALRKQAARCMDCATPYCQIGAEWNGATSGCPLYNLIPEWNELVRRGHWREAYERLIKTNNFPEFTSRACPAPCEGSCTAALPAAPVAIKSIERAIIDRAFAEGWVTARRPARRNGFKVAVVGSGPAGLACADELNQMGYRVTVFERADRPGGLLMYGIPNMKLEKSVVERRIQLLAEEGIAFVTGTEVGRDLAFREVRKRFDAVVLCIGSGKTRDLAIEGRDLQGVHQAMDYLTASTKALISGQPPAIDARGKRVIVIGGGDTGADCVAVALRQKCQSVIQFSRRGRLPDQRPSDNPWPEAPKVFKLDYGYEEAVATFGRDPRTYNVLPVRFVGKNDRVTGLVTVDVAFDDRGRLRELPGTERTWPADLVLLAVGFSGVEDHLFAHTGVAKSPQGTIAASRKTYQTDIPGVFAAGDARRGASLIVWAMREGRDAAAAVDRYLQEKKD